MNINRKIQIPSSAALLLDSLNSNGFEAFVVGGCVRDALLNKKPNDWDICTSATPEQVLDIFKGYKIIETGLKHGTVTVIINDEPFEITTYRIDGEYSDNRHPDKVTFTNDLKEDLSRRDIAINAMAYNPNTGVIDYFDGIEDLNNGIIRCVGDPDKRFQEDGLRIMRVIRFASTYDFTIDEKTKESLKRNKHLLDNIAAERINKELCKTILGPGVKDLFLNLSEPILQIIPELAPCIGFDQHSLFHVYDVYTHTIEAMDSYKGDDLNIKLALLFHDIGKPDCFTKGTDGGHFYGHAIESFEKCKEILKRLRFDNETIDNVSELVHYHDAQLEPTNKSVKKMLNRIGEEQFKRLLEVQKADTMAQSDFIKEKKLEKINSLSQILSDILEKEECFSLKDLAVNGRDIMEIGVKEGPEVGRVLGEVLDAIMEGKIENKKEEILAFVTERAKEKIKEEER